MISSPGAKHETLRFESGYDLSNSILKKLSLIGIIIGKKCRAREVNFAHSDLTLGILKRCDLSGCNFTDTIIHGTDFTESTLYAADFSHARIKRSYFKNAVLCNANMDNVVATGCNFENVDFKDCSMTTAKFTDCIFDNCTFSGAQLDGSSFKEGCTFNGSLFHFNEAHAQSRTNSGNKPASITGADFNGADLTTVIFFTDYDCVRHNDTFSTAGIEQPSRIPHMANCINVCMYERNQRLHGDAPLVWNFDDVGCSYVVDISGEEKNANYKRGRSIRSAPDKVAMLLEPSGIGAVPTCQHVKKGSGGCNKYSDRKGVNMYKNTTFGRDDDELQENEEHLRMSKSTTSRRCCKRNPRLALDEGLIIVGRDFKDTSGFELARKGWELKGAQDDEGYQYHYLTQFTTGDYQWIKELFKVFLNSPALGGADIIIHTLTTIFDIPNKVATDAKILRMKNWTLGIYNTNELLRQSMNNKQGVLKRACGGGGVARVQSFLYNALIRRFDYIAGVFQALHEDEQFFKDFNKSKGDLGVARILSLFGFGSPNNKSTEESIIWDNMKENGHSGPAKFKIDKTGIVNAVSSVVGMGALEEEHISAKFVYIPNECHDFMLFAMMLRNDASGRAESLETLAKHVESESTRIAAHVSTETYKTTIETETLYAINTCLEVKSRLPNPIITNTKKTIENLKKLRELQDHNYMPKMQERMYKPELDALTFLTKDGDGISAMDAIYQSPDAQPAESELPGYINYSCINLVTTELELKARIKVADATRINVTYTDGTFDTVDDNEPSVVTDALMMGLLNESSQEAIKVIMQEVSRNADYDPGIISKLQATIANLQAQVDNNQ